jgi:hypothetical protein
MTDDRSEATASGRLRPPGLGLFPQAKTQRAPSRNFGGGCDFPDTGIVGSIRPRFDIMPSSPMLHAALNRSGPISPCSNEATKMPSGPP